MSELFESAAFFLTGEMDIEYLVDGVIEKNTTGVMFGESGAGKSFIAVDLGLSVTVGVEIFNNKLAEVGLVLYVAGEGYGGLKRRVKAWQRYNEMMEEDMRLFHLSNKTICFDGTGVDTIIEEGKKLQEKFGVHVALIIIDTLARHMEGDENVTNDMGKFVKEVDRLRSNFSGSVVVIVHHTGHSETNRARGSSSLKAAMEFEIQIKKSTKQSTGKISFTKMKDSEPPGDMGFTLVPVNIGFDKNGNELTSCIVEYGDCAANPKKQKFLKGAENTGLEALVNVCVAENNKYDGKFYATNDGWKHEFYRQRLLIKPESTQDSLRMLFHRSGGGGVSDKLVSKGFISITEIGVFPLRETDQARIAAEINKQIQPEHCGTFVEHVQ